MLSADFRLPRVQGHMINALLSALLWLGIATLASGFADAVSRLRPY
ncbi:hypothetical protein LJR219_002482 [Phenylobacterium sp. LjRoot219]